MQAKTPEFFWRFGLVNRWNTVAGVMSFVIAMVYDTYDSEKSDIVSIS